MTQQFRDILARVQIDHRRIDELTEPPKKLKAASTKADTALAAVIREYGVMIPIVIDAGSTIVAGAKRFRAAKILNLVEVPTIQITHLTPKQLRIFAIADNQMAEMSPLDLEVVSAELIELAPTENIDLTGFAGAKLDFLLDGPSAKETDEKADAVTAVQEKAVSRLGDIWLLGRHRLFCGDAREGASYEAALGGARARMAFADVPYNVKIDGHAGGKGRHARREFVMASGEMTQAQFTEFLNISMAQMVSATTDGSIHYLCIDWRHLREMMDAGTQNYTELKNILAWVKDNAGMGTFYRSQHELIMVYKNGKAKHLNTFGLGESGRFRSNVLQYPGMNSFSRGRDEALAWHATVKPVALVGDIIRDVTKRGDWVLDPFAGSGTTAIAAEKCGRSAALIELDPLYCDVICRRWASFSQGKAVLEGGGMPFADVQRERTAGLDHE